MFRISSLFVVAVAFPVIGWCQAPAIFPGGIVNAANYVASPENLGLHGIGLGGGSLASIFGSNLASGNQTAEAGTLPIQLGGTSVMVWGRPAHILYISPGQIDLQLPQLWIPPLDPISATVVVVSTPAGSSEPYPLDPFSAFGIFSTDQSGCGQGAVLNVTSSGQTSVNSTSNSVSPGDFVSIYGTGLGMVYNTPPDGSPAPSSPLAIVAGGIGGFFFDLDVGSANFTGYWAGRAPGLVGVDQLNIQVPEDVRGGCAVPLQVASQSMSQPVTIAIRQGGGPCSDPPSAGFGQITWEKTVVTSPSASGGNSTAESDAVTVSLQASPGMQVPTPPVYVTNYANPTQIFFGPACPLPGYRSLDAGAVTVKGPSLALTLTPSAPLNGPIRGAVVYQSTLPNGIIQAGSYGVSASGGTDVGAFQSSVQIGSPIQITTPIAGQTFMTNNLYTIAWTGGDPTALVTVFFTNHYGYADFSYSQQAHVSDGSMVVSPFAFTGNDVGIVIEETPDPSQVPALPVPGLSLGLQHTWKYTYRFDGVSAF